MQLQRLFSAAGEFPVKMQKIPCSEGILGRRGDLAAFCCISGTKSRNINGLVLIFFIFARGRARGSKQ
jgi:hypothetical protein